MILLLSTASWACSIATGDVFTPDTSLADGVLPPTPEVAVEVGRGRGGVQEGCSTRTTSCDDLGMITLTFANRPEGAGVRLQRGTGSLPEGLGLPDEAMLPFGGAITLVWIDGAEDVQEAFEGTLQVAYIDAGGEVSDPVTVAVADDGDDGCGGAGAGWAWLLVLPWARRRQGSVETRSSAVCSMPSGPRERIS